MGGLLFIPSLNRTIKVENLEEFSISFMPKIEVSNIVIPTPEKIREMTKQHKEADFWRVFFNNFVVHYLPKIEVTGNFQFKSSKKDKEDAVHTSTTGICFPVVTKTIADSTPYGFKRELLFSNVKGAMVKENGVRVPYVEKYLIPEITDLVMKVTSHNPAEVMPEINNPAEIKAPTMNLFSAVKTNAQNFASSFNVGIAPKAVVNPETAYNEYVNQFVAKFKGRYIAIPEDEEMNILQTLPEEFFGDETAVQLKVKDAIATFATSM